MQAVIWSLPHFADITIWQLVHGILLYVTDNFLGIFSTAIPKLTHITPTHSHKPTSGWVWIPNHLAYPYVWLDLMNYKHRCISHAPFIFREKRTIQHSVISFCLEVRPQKLGLLIWEHIDIAENISSTCWRLNLMIGALVWNDCYDLIVENFGKHDQTLQRVLLILVKYKWCFTVLLCRSKVCCLFV